MTELDRAALKSEIVAELIVHLSLHPEIFEVFENAPWQRTTAIRPSGTDADWEGTDRPLPAWVAAKIQGLERAVRDLGQLRSQVESRERAADGHSEPAAVGAPEPADHASTSSTP